MAEKTADFTKNFREFVKPYLCGSHGEAPTIVCIDRHCKQRELICSLCLTIHGRHKGHDSIEVSKFVEQCLRTFAHDPRREDLARATQEIADHYGAILRTLTDFHEAISNTIKAYIAKRNHLHLLREGALLSDQWLASLRECRFNNLDEMNGALNSLISCMSPALEVTAQSQDRLLSSAQLYLEDLRYEESYISRHLREVELRMRQLLVVKESSPIVFAEEPAFHAPKLIESADLVYMGETRLDRPHGRGMCFFKNSQKLMWGNFQNGQLEGTAELHFSTGDYYLGEFRQDRKEGRGIYWWAGRDSDRYEGEFKDGKRHGRGTFWWSDGSKYEGEFVHGVQSGQGTLYRPAGGKEYEGGWSKGMFDGQGTQYFENDERYEGTFKEDKFNGEGVFYKEDSVIYGVWKDSELAVVNMVKSTLGP